MLTGGCSRRIQLTHLALPQRHLPRMSSGGQRKHSRSDLYVCSSVNGGAHQGCRKILGNVLARMLASACASIALLQMAALRGEISSRPGRVKQIRTETARFFRAAGPGSVRIHTQETCCAELVNALLEKGEAYGRFRKDPQYVADRPNAGRVDSHSDAHRDGEDRRDPCSR